MINEENKIGQEHLYQLLTEREIGWKDIIYDLINSEQLNPWDIDLALLANRYLVKIREFDEANFFVSSKVLLAASLLLRIKSEILLNEYIRDIDDILFGKKQDVSKVQERIVLEGTLPVLYPKSPLPRMRKVSLDELMSALNKAIDTEHRRIKKEIGKKQMEREAETVMPRTRINVKDRIKKIYSRILTMFKAKQERIGYTELVGKGKEERIACFLPVLHLENQQRVFLEQEKHFSEIWVWLYTHYKKLEAEKIAQGLVKEEENLEKEEMSEIAGFDNPLAGMFDEI